MLQRFRPITLERPKVLLPLVGVPLLDYTLEWLASNNVAEVRSCSVVPRITFGTILSRGRSSCAYC